MQRKSIGILTKPKFPEVKETLQSVVSWLRAKNIVALLDTTSAALLGETGGIQKTQLASQGDVLLVLGGDGTMLNAARLAVLYGDGKHHVPLDGVIETMRQTGLDMHGKYKETSQGGLSVNLADC